MEQGEELERTGSALRAYLRSELDAIEVRPLSTYLPDRPSPSARPRGTLAGLPLGVGAAALLLVFAVVVGEQLRTYRDPASASATPTTTPSAPPFGLSPEYGLLALTRDGFVVRRETDPTPIRRIEPTSHRYERTVAISRNGRFVAYWGPRLPSDPVGDVLMVYDAATNADPRPVLTVENEIGGPLVWADDDSGIAFTTVRYFRGLSLDPPPQLSVVQMQGTTATGQARLIAIGERGNVIVPLAWIRETGSVSAVEGDGSGVASTYLLADESGRDLDSVRRVAISSGDQVVRTANVVANQQSRMLAYLVTFTCQDGSPGCTLIRFWALEDPRIAVGWQNIPGSTFVRLVWRPYSRDLLVRTRDDRTGVERLEVWNSSPYGPSQSRTPLPTNASGFIIRPDGRSIFVAALSGTWPATLYDLTSSATLTTDLATTGGGSPTLSVTLGSAEAGRLDTVPRAAALLSDTEAIAALRSRLSASDRIDTISASLDRGTYPLGGAAPVWTVKAVGQFQPPRGPISTNPVRCQIAKVNARTGQLAGIQFFPNESDCR